MSGNACKLLLHSARSWCAGHAEHQECSKHQIQYPEMALQAFVSDMGGIEFGA